MGGAVKAISKVISKVSKIEKIIDPGLAFAKKDIEKKQASPWASQKRQKPSRYRQPLNGLGLWQTPNWLQRT